MTTMNTPAASTDVNPAADIHHGGAPAADTRGDRPTIPTIFAKTSPGARAVTFPYLDVEESVLPSSLLGTGPDWPELGMPQVIRHYTHLGQRQFSIDAQFYPLGSCTMKHNPRINEFAAGHPGFTGLHPMQDDADTQGALRLLYETRCFLQEIAGLHEASLQPAAGGARGVHGAEGVPGALQRDRSAAADEGAVALECPRDEPGVVRDVRGARDFCGCTGRVHGHRRPQAHDRRRRRGHDRGVHDHEPEHGGPVRSQDQRDRGDRARRGRFGVPRRREHERDSWQGAAG